MQIKSAPQPFKKGVIIVSGGMDSVTLLHYLVSKGLEMEALSFYYGQKHSKELECAKENCALLGVKHTIIDLSFLGDILESNLLSKGDEIPEGHYEAENMKQTVVPNRNMIMSSIAVGRACSIGAQFVALGVHAGDHAIYPDCREEFIEAFTKAVELCDWNACTIWSPFQYMTKKDILEIGFECGVDYAKTLTCYNGREKACGKCGSCSERVLAFLEIGIKDPLQYEKTWEEQLEFTKSLAKSD